MALAEDWSDYIARRRLNTGRTYTLRERKAAFLLATVLALVGTALQLACAWPGCCPAWGITP